MSIKESDYEKKQKPKFDLDKVLVDEIGQFGKFHIKITAICILSCMFVSWNLNEFLFTAARIQTRCLISECDDPSQTEFTPPWITNAVPSDGGSVDMCQRFGNTSALLPVNDSCPASLFDTSVLQQCEEYVYENTNSMVYDFGLACEEWRRAMIGSVRIFGMMVALAITGYISDRWGRHRALALNTSCAAVLGVVRYWAPSYNVYVIMLFVESVAGCATYTCGCVLLVELLGTRYRVLGGAIMNTSFAIGKIILGLIAWAVPEWKNLILAVYIPQFLCILFFWMRIESVRWLMSKGRFEDVEVLLNDAARINGKQMSQKSLDDLRINAEEEMRKESERNDKPPIVLMVFKDRRILRRCFVTSVWWITSTLVYYGLSFNALNLTGNMYLNFIVVCAVEPPGTWTAVLIIDRIGRKPTLIAAFWLCAACQLGFIFISKDIPALPLIVYVLGKYFIAIVTMTMNMFTLELFPTEYRHRLYNFSSMMGRLGSIVAPLTPAIAATVYDDLPYILFGGMALLAGVLTFLVPETNGSKLADTMEEALEIERK